jgi:hypothetical protein
VKRVHVGAGVVSEAAGVDHTRRSHDSEPKPPIKARCSTLPQFGLTAKIDSAPSTAAISSPNSEDQPWYMSANNFVVRI